MIQFGFMALVIRKGKSQMITTSPPSYMQMQTGTSTTKNLNTGALFPTF